MPPIELSGCFALTSDSYLYAALSDVIVRKRGQLVAGLLHPRGFRRDL